MARRTQEGDLHEASPSCPQCGGDRFVYMPHVKQREITNPQHGMGPNWGEGHMAGTAQAECEGCGHIQEFDFKIPRNYPFPRGISHEDLKQAHTGATMKPTSGKAFWQTEAEEPEELDVPEDYSELDVPYYLQGLHNNPKHSFPYGQQPPNTKPDQDTLQAEAMIDTRMDFKLHLNEIAGLIFDTDLPNRQRVIRSLKEMGYSLDPMPGDLLEQGKAVFVNEEGYRVTVQVDHPCPYVLYAPESKDVVFTSPNSEEFIEFIKKGQ